MVRRRLAAALAVLLLVACGGSDGDGSSAGPSAAITIESFSFGDPISVAPGTTVEVTNADGANHTWTSVDDVFDSGTLASGETFRFTFDDPGDYQFLCRIHPSMTGSITVSG